MTTNFQNKSPTKKKKEKKSYEWIFAWEFYSRTFLHLFLPAHSYTAHRHIHTHTEYILRPVLVSMANKLTPQRKRKPKQTHIFGDDRGEGKTALSMQHSSVCNSANTYTIWRRMCSRRKIFWGFKNKEMSLRRNPPKPSWCARWVSECVCVCGCC